MSMSTCIVPHDVLRPYCDKKNNILVALSGSEKRESEQEREREVKILKRNGTSTGTEKYKI